MSTESCKWPFWYRGATCSQRLVVKPRVLFTMQIDTDTHSSVITKVASAASIFGTSMMGSRVSYCSRKVRGKLEQHAPHS